jgi:ribosome recycling factor
MEALKKSQKQGSITEDDLVKYEKEAQKLTDTYVKRIDDALTTKEAEIMKV